MAVPCSPARVERVTRLTPHMIRISFQTSATGAGTPTAPATNAWTSRSPVPARRKPI